MEIGFDDEVPDSLVVELPDGKILDVGIEYPWKPENVCIAKRFVTYPNSVLLDLPRLGFPRIRVRFTGNPKEKGKIVLNPVNTPMVSDVNILLENC